MPELTFRLSDTLADEAAAAFAEHRSRILERVPDAEIRHTGATSIPGVLTAGDVDVHVRVEAAAFDRARDALRSLYSPIHLDMWSDEGAFYTAPGSRPPVEIALTAIGGSDDLHHGEAWRRIAADDRLVERYNALKRQCEGGSAEDYRVAKRAFFYDVLERPP